MRFVPTSIPGLIVIEPIVHGDNRGYFTEVFRLDLFRQHIGDVQFVQDNESVSTKGVLRGLHFQRPPFAQAKLVRVSRGAVVDIVVDLRKDSPTLGRYEMVTLSADNHRQLFVPRGMAHGFVVLSDDAQFQYKVDNVYAPHAEATLRYDDATLAIPYPQFEVPFGLSDKDCDGVDLLRAIEMNNTPIE